MQQAQTVPGTCDFAFHLARAGENKYINALRRYKQYEERALLPLIWRGGAQDRELIREGGLDDVQQFPQEVRARKKKRKKKTCLFIRREKCGRRRLFAATRIACVCAVRYGLRVRARGTGVA